ncbi:MAG: hypothetical protein V9E99_08100 [Microthrixaceae bacterium]
MIASWPLVHDAWINVYTRVDTTCIHTVAVPTRSVVSSQCSTAMVRNTVV